MNMVGKFLFYGECPSPLGTLTFVSTEKGICAVEFGPFSEYETSLKQWAGKWCGPTRWIRDDGAFEDAFAQMREYFLGGLKRFELPLDLWGTPFQIRVWRALQDIPYGQTRSYGELAEIIGNPKASRAVGQANHFNPVPIIVPCHRVIGARGHLTGYGGGIRIKQFLLDLEKRHVAKPANQQAG